MNQDVTFDPYPQEILNGYIPSFSSISRTHQIFCRRNSTSTMSTCSLSTSLTNLSQISKRSNSGRTAGPILYEIVDYEGKKYVVATLQHNHRDVKFVFDHEDYMKVSERNWHVTSGKYIGTNVKVAETMHKEVFLHTYLIKDLTFVDEEDNNYVVHINKNTFDNRRENLRIVKASDLFLLKTKKKRIIQLPDDAGIQVEDIPKHVCYVKPNGDHGARFSIELPTLGICWKTTSTNKVSLQDKLAIAKEKLEEIYKIYPEINPKKDTDLVEHLNRSFTEICKLAEKA